MFRSEYIRFRNDSDVHFSYVPDAICRDVQRAIARLIL